MVIYQNIITRQMLAILKRSSESWGLFIANISRKDISISIILKTHID